MDQRVVVRLVKRYSPAEFVTALRMSLPLVRVTVTPGIGVPPLETRPTRFTASEESWIELEGIEYDPLGMVTGIALRFPNPEADNSTVQSPTGTFPKKKLPVEVAVVVEKI